MDGATGAGVRLDLLGEEDPLRQVRRFVRVQAEQCGLEERGDDAVQAAAELLEGAEGDALPTAVRVGEAGEGGLVIAVDLRGSTELHLREHSETLLAGLSADWGWEPSPQGVHAWCRLAAVR